MHKNLIWQAFLLVILTITFIYTVLAAYRYYNYSTLKSQAFPFSIQWNIEKKSEEEFLIKATYQFKIDQNSFSGSTVWFDQPYRNAYAAQKGIDELSKISWQIWYNPSNPINSSLQKKYPFKELISAAFLWILFLYFLWLGYYYVARFKQN